MKTVDEAKRTITGQMLPNTLLLGSATEFDLQCETDAANPAKDRQDDSTASTVQRSVDSLSGGFLVTTTALSFDSAENVTDSSAELMSDQSAGSEVCNEKVLPLLKHRKKYSAKASWKSLFLCVCV